MFTAWLLAGRRLNKLVTSNYLESCQRKTSLLCAAQWKHSAKWVRPNSQPRRRQHETTIRRSGDFIVPSSSHAVSVGHQIQIGFDRETSRRAPSVSTICENRLTGIIRLSICESRLRNYTSEWDSATNHHQYEIIFVAHRNEKHCCKNWRSGTDFLIGSRTSRFGHQFKQHFKEKSSIHRPR